MSLLTRKLYSFRIRRNRAFGMHWHRNGGEYRSIFDNKHVLSAVLRGWGISVPEDLAILNQSGIAWFSENSRKSDQWPDWLNHLDAGKYFVKPVRGNHGRHAGLLEKTEDAVHFNGARIEADQAKTLLLAQPTDFLLQRWIEQHPAMSIHCDSTVNTIRALTVRLCSKRVIVFHTVMRNGRSDRYLDNFHAGGIAVLVDMGTGKTTGQGVQLRPRASLQNHPDSGMPLAGNSVPHFDRLKAVLIRAHTMFPGLRTVGWDVAVSTEGPTIVEGNLDWDVEIHAFCDPGFRGSLAEFLQEHRG